jgi:hypothetical protein
MKTPRPNSRILIRRCLTTLVACLVVPLTHDAQGVRSITDLFNIDAPLKASQAPFTRKESTTVSSRFFPERKMRKIEVRMTSQTYRGVKCGHDTTIYLPDRNGPKDSQGTAAIILGGGGIRVEDAKLDWLESIVLGLEVPCVGDPRIIGAYPTAWNSGDVFGYTRLKGERWGWNVKPKQTGPAGQTARQSMAMLDSPRGRKYLELFDSASNGPPWVYIIHGRQ